MDTSSSSSLNEQNFNQITTDQKKRKSDETTNSSCHLVTKIFRSESKSLPFGIANVLQSSSSPSSSSSSSSSSIPSSVSSSINPWFVALQQLSQPSSSTNALLNASNWCAKCSIQFRLTSELVHHIRVQHTHRRQSSSSSYQQSTTTTKHSTILTCQICYETFRERHHLTRHMTSHR